MTNPVIGGNLCVPSHLETTGNTLAPFSIVCFLLIAVITFKDFFLFFFCGNGGSTKDFVHRKQVFHH